MMRIEQVQLAALDELGADFAPQIDYWVFGGWAVDFYFGRITRAHSDIDIAIGLSVDRVTSKLEKDGWHAEPDDGAGYYRAFTRGEVLP